MVTFGDQVYQALFEPLPQAIVVMRDDAIAWLNGAAEKLLRHRRDDVIGTALGRWLDADVARLRLLALEGGRAPVLAGVVQRSDGPALEVDVHAESLTVGSDPLLRLTILERDSGADDPSHAHRHQQRRRAAESELRAIFQALPDHFLRIDAHGRVLEYNAPDDAVPFPTPMRFIGRPMHEMLPLEVAESLTDAIESAMDTGQVKTLEYSMPLAGVTRHFEARIVPYSADRLIAIVRDVTDRKRIEEQTLMARKLESIERLAGGLAHEFNNLLTAVMAHGELARLDLPAGSSVRAHLDPILTATERAADLTKKLLAFSRDHLAEVAPVDLKELLGQLLGALRHTLGDDVQLRFVSRAADACVVADPRLLEKAIFNIVLNAREAMPDGGSLTVALREVRVGPHFAAKQLGLHCGEYVAMFFRDSGCGMAEATLRRAFDPFFTTKRTGEGSGLGLPTTHGIVKQLGGHVFALSRPGRGTTVAIYVPRAGKDDYLAPWSAPPAAKQPRGRILLVEDEGAVREVVYRVLTQLGYAVATSENGIAAERLAESEGCPYDLVVTDVVMPQMGGRELVQRLRAKRPALRVLYMSGYTQSALAPSDLHEPGTGFLQKPFSRASLVDELGRLLTEPVRAPAR